MHVLIVWQQSMGLCSKEVSIPDSQQGQDNLHITFTDYATSNSKSATYRNVLVQVSCSEVVVHPVSS